MSDRRVSRRRKTAQSGPAPEPEEPSSGRASADPADGSGEDDGDELAEPEILEAGADHDAPEIDAELDDPDLSDENLSDESHGGDAHDSDASRHGREAALPSSSTSLVPRSGGLVPNDALSQYFQEIGQYPLLTRSQEHDLAVQVHDRGDREAAQKLVLSNLRLVVKIAMEYRRVWTNLLDLIQEGNVGLLQAVRRFDPYRGVKLSSYGAYWIRAYILKYLIDNIRTVRMGSSRAERKVFYSLSRARRELEKQGFVPTPALLAERLEVQPEDVESVQRRLSQADLSLDAPVSADPGAATLGDRQSSPERRLDEVVSERDMQLTFREHVQRFSAQLDERESLILRERMLADEPSTLQEIGDRLHLTRERVRQIEKKIVDRLRAYMKENLVDFDYWAPED